MLQAIKGVGAGTCEWKETYELKDFSPKSAIKEATSKTANGSILEVTVYNHKTLPPDRAIGSGTVDLARLGSSCLPASIGAKALPGGCHSRRQAR